MSLSYVPLKPVLVRDNRTIIDTEKQFAIIKSCKEIKYKQWTSNSVASGSIQWTVPPPAAKFIVDRRIKMQLPIRAQYTGIVQPGAYLFNPNYDAPRQFPIQSSINTISMAINNYTVTQNFGEYIHGLLCFNTAGELLQRDYSMTPSCPDISQSYTDLIGSVNNPLSMAGDTTFDNVKGRGGFGGWKVALNPQNTTLAPLQLTGYIDFLVTESIFMSPLYWGAFQQIGAGFINVTSMDFTVNFYTLGAQRLLSHANGFSTMVDNSAQMYFKDFPTADPNVPSNPPIPFSYGMGTVPLLFIKYLTPLDSLMINNHTPITYPYFTITKYPTDITPLPVLSHGGNPPNPSGVFQSNNLQLSNIPRRLYIWVRPSNNNLFSNPSVTDCFYKISGLTIQFDNRLLLSEASEQDLYEISRKNHLNLDWDAFAGNSMYQVGGSVFNEATRWNGRGTLLCFEPATDWGLSDNQASGMGGQYNFQISNMTVTNINSSGEWDFFTPTIYVLAIAEGSFVVPESGQATADLSIVTPMDILNAQDNTNDHVSYNETQLINGGTYFSNIKGMGLKDKLHEVQNFLKRNKIISSAAYNIANSKEPLKTAIGREYFNQVANAAKHSGYGMRGGEVMDPRGIDGLASAYGGRRVDHDNLRSRLMQR